MTHLVDELARQAAQEMAHMRAAACRARAVHARAELMRHMFLTAKKVAHRPRHEAVDYVVTHWMQAWGLEPESWPHVAEMEHFSGCFHDYAREPGEAQDAAVRAAAEGLEKAFTAAGMPLADQMAWRSECAHGWWAQVSPPPPGRGRADRDWPEAPFWSLSCPQHCR